MAASGASTVDFGAFPGSDGPVSTVITGQTGILAGSKIGAWIVAAATADHLADEHVVEDIDITCGAIVAGTGFTIYATSRSLGDTRPYGLWTVHWAWA